MPTLQWKFERLVRVASIACLVFVSCVTTNVSAQTRAALVRDSDNPALAPVTLLKSFPIDNSAVTLGTVPAGKRFVVQNVSYLVQFNNAGTSSQLYTPSLTAGSGSAPAVRLIIPTSPVQLINGSHVYNASFAATAYFESGESINAVFTVSDDPSTAIAGAYVVVTGFYVTP